MGSVVQLKRRPPRLPAPRKLRPDAEAQESTRSLLILMGGFFFTALAMCMAVVIAASSTWTDVAVMSLFVIVFALLKIVLANALFWSMIRCDRGNEVASASAKSGAVFRRRILESPRVAAAGNGATGIRRTAAGNSSNARLALLPRKSPRPRR